MDALISVIALIVEVFGKIISLPENQVERKKQKLARIFSNLVNQIQIIVNQGYAILRMIEKIPLDLTGWDFVEWRDELEHLLDQQIARIEVLLEVVYSSEKGDDDLTDKYFNLFSETGSNNNIPKILSIYGPETEYLFREVVYSKRENIKALLHMTKASVESFNSSQMLLLERGESLRENLKKYHMDIYIRIENDFKENKGYFHRVNLINPLERFAYLDRANKRLKDLQKSSEQLRLFISDHFEPHHLI
jgi:hypothetical protein